MLKPEISVIACHHRGDFVFGFVASVMKSVKVTYEIIVITSDSELATTGIPHCNVQYYDGMPAAKRNCGARLAKADYLAFFDDDVEIEPDCLHHLLYSIEEPITGMVYGKLLKADEPTRFDEAGGYITSTGFIWSRAGQNIVDTGQFDSHAPIFAGKSASCIVKKSIFNKVDGFDEDFEILGEESDLSWRIWLHGYKVMFNPYARGIHYFNTKWKPSKEYYNSKRVNYNGCRNYITMLIKNLEAKHLWTILPVHILIWIFAGFAMFITGKVIQGLNIFQGIGYIVMNLKHIISKRSQVQERRKVSDADIWPYIFSKTPRGYYLQRFTRYITLGLHG